MVGDRSAAGDRDPAYDAVQYLLLRKGDLADLEAEWEPIIHPFCSGLGIDSERVTAWLFARLVSDAIAARGEEGESVASLEAIQGDLWSARLVHRLRNCPGCTGISTYRIAESPVSDRRLTGRCLVVTWCPAAGRLSATGWPNGECACLRSART